MPSLEVPVSVPAAVYVGTYGATSVLTQVLATRTAGINIVEDIPKTYIRATDTYELTGNHAVTITMTFLAEDDTVWKIARSVPITGGINDAPTTGHYTLYIVFPDGKAYYFPNLCTTSALEVPYRKDGVTAIKLVLANQTPDYSVSLFKRGTTSTLAADLGSRNPL